MDAAIKPNASRRTQNRYMEKRKKYYKAILKNLAKQKGICKTDEECRVARLFSYQSNGKRFKEAARNVRIQFGMADRFRQGLIASGRYMQHMQETFESHGLPLELLVLPHVESSFDVKAYSKMGAAGIWQFTRSTGRRYLKINYSVDQRSDPFLATEAAAKLLKKNFKDLGSWPLAITAYNHGRYGMLRAKKKHGGDLMDIIENHNSRRFGFASKNFYAEFLAAKKIAQNPERYFGPIGYYIPLVHDTVTIKNYVPVSLLTSHFRYSLADLKFMNPALRRSIWNGTRRIPKGYLLRVPYGSGEMFDNLYASAPKNMLFSEQLIPEYYKIGRGDTLWDIARRFRTTIRTLQVYNDLSGRSRIYAGQKLRIPPKNYHKYKEEIRVASVASPLNSMISGVSAKTIEPIIKMKVDYRKGRDIDDLTRSFNPILDKDLSLFSGLISLEPAPPIEVPQTADYMFVRIAKGYGVIRVQPGETLGHYSFWSGVSLRKIQRLNGWKRKRSITHGQKIRIPLNVVTDRRFENNRYEYHLGLFEDFFAAYRIEKVESVMIGSGQSIWSICNETYDTPLWLVRLYNRDIELGKLRPGEKIQMPIVEKIDANS
jgi:membrane-bound lytic murein transglycosylase D